MVKSIFVAPVKIFLRDPNRIKKNVTFCIELDSDDEDETMDLKSNKLSGEEQILSSDRSRLSSPGSIDQDGAPRE